MPEQIPIATFITQTWEDYKSPPTSTFDKKMVLCRNTMTAIEEELDTDRSELTKLKKSIRALYNTTNKHAQNEADIAKNLDRIGKSTNNQHKEINSAFHDFAQVTKVLSSLIEDLSKSLHNSLQFPLESFLKGDITGVKGDLRKPFDKAWRDYESKFSKLEKDAKKKANEAGLYRSELSGGEVAEEMEKERKIFQLQFCMYLIKVNEMKTKKGVDLLQSMIEYYKAVKLFFEQGQSAIEKHQSFVQNLGQQLKDIKQAQNQERANLTELQTSLKNSMSGYKEPSSTVATPRGYNLHQLQGNKTHGSEKDGYLLKKSEGMLKKVWQKRKCTITDGIMLIRHSDETKAPVKLNLLTCQVKLVPDDPGKKCFDLVSSHGNRTYHFQADDENEMGKWISVLSNAKEAVLLKAFQDSSSSPTVNKSVLELAKSIISRVKSLPGNEVCCDCGSPGPEWLSTNLGVLICLECCGIHRNLGVHISRTQSITIDQLGTSQLLLARVIGNDDFNEVLEARLGEDTLKPNPDSPMLQREEFIKSKYVQHKFTIQTCSDTAELQQDLQQAIQACDIQSLLQVYAEGLDLMTMVPDSAIDETGLHLAVAEEDGNSLPIVDFIVQNSNLNSLGRQTKDGNTPLHICAQVNKSECMKCILRLKPDVANIKNNAGLTALDIASENNYQLCAELLKAAMAGKKDVFENVNFEWDLISEDQDGLDFSDDECIDTLDRKPRSRPSSIVGMEMSGREVSPHDWKDTEGNRRSQMPSKPRKHHHLTHPTRFRNSLRNIPGLNSFPSQTLSQSLPNTTEVSGPGPKTPKKPILPPRGVRPPGPLPPGPPGPMPGGFSHVRNVSDSDTNTFVFDHKRTPSEPPLRAGSRQTVAFSNFKVSPTELHKPLVPTRPRALSSNEVTDSRTTDRDTATSKEPETPPPVPIPRKPLPKKTAKRCRALFDCDADNEDELTFREGEIIILLRQDEEDWWEGEVEGQAQRRGLFPLSFVKELDN